MSSSSSATTKFLTVSRSVRNSWRAPGILPTLRVTKVASMTVRAHSASNARATVMAVVRTTWIGRNDCRAVE